jgi:hypothetical protein
MMMDPYEKAALKEGRRIQRAAQLKQLIFVQTEGVGF